MPATKSPHLQKKLAWLSLAHRPSQSPRICPPFSPQTSSDFAMETPENMQQDLGLPPGGMAVSTRKSMVVRLTLPGRGDAAAANVQMRDNSSRNEAGVEIETSTAPRTRSTREKTLYRSRHSDEGSQHAGPRRSGRRQHASDTLTGSRPSQGSGDRDSDDEESGHEESDDEEPDEEEPDDEEVDQEDPDEAQWDSDDGSTSESSEGGNQDNTNADKKIDSSDNESTASLDTSDYEIIFGLDRPQRRSKAGKLFNPLKRARNAKGGVPPRGDDHDLDGEEVLPVKRVKREDIEQADVKHTESGQQQTDRAPFKLFLRRGAVAAVPVQTPATPGLGVGSTGQHGIVSTENEIEERRPALPRATSDAYPGLHGSGFTSAFSYAPGALRHDQHGVGETSSNVSHTSGPQVDSSAIDSLTIGDESLPNHNKHVPIPVSGESSQAGFRHAASVHNSGDEEDEAMRLRLAVAKQRTEVARRQLVEEELLLEMHEAKKRKQAEAAV
ncbi:hypothetical protein LTS10_010570 [Elasticomyces elasticus]|nr:hypothetical protein LTS10_010570 [Elasticomyces elasticus]